MKPAYLSRILLSVLLLLCGNVFAQKNSSNPTGDSKSETKLAIAQASGTNREIARRLFEEILNTGKFELLNQIVAEDYVGVAGQKGPSAFAQPINELRQSFPDIQWTIEDLIEDGDRVAVRSKWQGTHANEFRGFAATRKQVTVPAIAIFQFKNGKIVQSWLQTDRLGFLQQIGAVPKDLGTAPQPLKKPSSQEN